MGLFDLYTYYTLCYISKWWNYFKVYWSGHLILTTFFSLFWLYDAYNFTIHRNVDFDNCRQSDNVLLSQFRDIKLLEYNSIFLIDLSIMLYMITCAQLIFFFDFFSENMYIYVLFYRYGNKEISQPFFHKLLRNGLFCRWPGFDTFFSC